MFNIEYQLLRNDLYAFSSGSFIPYVMVKRHIELINEILVGQEHFRFNRHTRRLYIDGNWDSLVVGSYAMIDCYMVTDPETYTDTWNDPWLKKYVTALVKKQWGENLSKFAGVALPGGITLDGRSILADAQREIAELEESINDEVGEPLLFQIG